MHLGPFLAGCETNWVCDECGCMCHAVNSESKHTPGPWSAPSAGVYDSDGIMIASCGTHTIVEELRAAGFGPAAIADRIAANATFIVRACNSHDKLLEACQEAEEAARLAGIHQMPDGRDCPWYTALKAAIAAATGE